MTDDSIYDALETCLQALDGGADVESCLASFPKLADELRPILDAAIEARAASVTDVPVDVVRRGRARVLQTAAEMREQQMTAPVLPGLRRKSLFSPRFYRLAATTAVVIIFLLTGGTGLVNASNNALPGDKLYPVKRGWEGVQLAFILDPHTKAELENKFDSERKSEIEELYSEKRLEQVSFGGMVEQRQPGVWRVSGLDVAVENESDYSEKIAPGAVVQIVGETDDGIIKAKQIILISTPGITPTSVSPSSPVPLIIQNATPESGEKPENIQTPETEEDSHNPESTATPNASGKPDDGNGTKYSTSATPHPRIDDSDSSGGTGGDDKQDNNDDSESSPGDSGNGDD